MRLALALEYDGQPFCGWQSQPSRCGVQDALERAMGMIAGATVRATAAGRTADGAHATSQIVHVDVESERPLTAWVRGVNAHLPPQVAVRWARVVEPAFHARYSATARHYTYLLLNRAVRPALLARRVGWYHQLLDIVAMRDAARLLLGTHDFSAFRAAECQARSPVKTLWRADVERDQDLVVFRFAADAFLQHMVRNIVGTLVAVGAGKHTDALVVELLAQKNRSRAAPTFAPHGLYFTGADYPAAFHLPATGAEVDATTIALPT